MPRNPMQPFIRDESGHVRFKANAIVRALLDAASDGVRMDMNRIAAMDFTQDDRCQFAQLIGYSLCGYHELPYVSDLHAESATVVARMQLGNDEIGGCRDTGCEIHCGVPLEPV